MKRILSSAVVTGALTILAVTGWAAENVSVVRSGYFREITDAVASGYVVQHLR